MSVAATVTELCQIGPDDWRLDRHTKVFDNEDTFETVFHWAKQILGPKAEITINDISFSQNH